MQTILLQEPKISGRWVSGQFSESNSKGKRHCGLIKAISSQRTKCINSVNSPILHPSTVQSFRNLTKESCGSAEVSHGADQRLVAGFKGIREYSTVTGSASEREATAGSPSSPWQCVLPQALAHPGFPLCNFTEPWAAEPTLTPTPAPRPQEKPPPRSAAEVQRGPLPGALTHQGYRRRSVRPNNWLIG